MQLKTGLADKEPRMRKKQLFYQIFVAHISLYFRNAIKTKKTEKQAAIFYFDHSNAVIRSKILILTLLKSFKKAFLIFVYSKLLDIEYLFSDAFPRLHLVNYCKYEKIPSYFKWCNLFGVINK